ncbi:MAG: hypothetical protein PUD43_03435, partial [Clostridia bacterium]|nr:hypothetical protein [Clostridia bacterium]
LMHEWLFHRPLALKHAILLGEERGLRLRIKLGKLFVFQTFPPKRPVCLQFEVKRDASLF